MVEWTDWCPITVNAQKAGYVACFWVCMLSQLCLTDCSVITPRKFVMCFSPICIFKFDQTHPKKIAWRHNDRELRLAHDQNPPIGLPPSATWPRWFQYLIRYWKRRGPVKTDRFEPDMVRVRSWVNVTLILSNSLIKAKLTVNLVVSD